MLLDTQNLFSRAQDLAVAVGNHLSDKSIDLGATGSHPWHGSPLSDPGRGLPIYVHAQVVEAFDSDGGAATVQAQLVQADDAALTSNLEVLAETPAVAEATLVPGYTFRLSCLPAGISKRYLGLRYVVAGETATAGKVTAGIVRDRDTAVHV